MDGIIKNLIRVGRVSSVDPATATARVVFEAQNVVSYDLPVIQRQTLKNKDYCLPDVGEHVVCIFLPTGNAEGFILGAIYSDQDEPPATDVNKRLVQFEDGTIIEYDRATSTLTIDAAGPINITSTEIVNLTVNGPVNITASGDMKLQGQDISITASGNMGLQGNGISILAQNTFTVTAPGGASISGISTSESW